MPLYNIQDNDRPLWIIARDYRKAEYIWKKIIATENQITIDEVEPPLGISFVCDGLSLVLNGDSWDNIA